MSNIGKKKRGLQVMGKLVQIAQSSQRDCLYTHSKQMADEVNAMNDQREASSPTCYVADYRRSLFRHQWCLLHCWDDK